MSLCRELAAILERELSLGNSLGQAPHRAGWPHAALHQDFKSDLSQLPPAVQHGHCNDPHYGWYEQLYCREHHHLLVAGTPKSDRR
ncbi:hypothetical protein D16iCDA_12485 [Pseudomonas seleniipraecipitans]|uniref:Uncharacterized protein n=1 Tax=Phytopseudomonas seleniipraecipitans TaxID=640205 RepID=A0ABY5J6V5_9GAMM|nr:hypothetical protein [Pseudomonas seleniipraecipitans]UUD62517.1 hypothetical protein D16iCDA_12485 [Pseudomonas seleniipraecipitans]